MNSLPFKLNEQLEDYAVLRAVKRINICPTSSSVEYDSSRDGKHSLGDYVQILNGETENTFKEWRRGAVVVMKTGYRYGSL